MNDIFLNSFVIYHANQEFHLYIPPPMNIANVFYHVASLVIILLSGFNLFASMVQFQNHWLSHRPSSGMVHNFDLRIHEYMDELKFDLQ